MKNNNSTWKINIESSDADFISDTISRAYAPCLASPIDRTEKIKLSADIVGYQDFSIARADFRNGIMYSPQTQGEFFLCHVPIVGSTKIGFHNKELDAGDNSITFCNALNIKTISYSKNRSDIVYMASIESVRSLISHHMGYNVKILNDFSIVIDKSSFLGSAFFNYTTVIMDLMTNKHLLKNSSIQMKKCRDAFIELAISSLNMGQILDLAGKRFSIGLNEVVRAEDYMFANRREPIGMGDVANHLGISLRAVQYSFKRYRGISPLATLTRYRLEGLRDELLVGSELSIAEIAASWGFVHASRLSVIYRKAFGENPRDTAKRSRFNC